MIQTEKILVKTENEDHIVNITDVVQNTLTKSGVKEGFILVFLQSTTSSLTVMEFEDGVLIDLPRALGRLAPKSIDYEHEKAYRDGIEHSHVKSSAVGIDLAVPFKDGFATSWNLAANRSCRIRHTMAKSLNHRPDSQRMKLFA